MEDRHSRKMIAPIVITVLMVMYYVGFFVTCIFMPMPAALKLLFGLAPILLTGVCIFVLAERIKEIRSGEEDDLSQY